jgi:ketosteroid isomerase-like protein
VSDENVELAHRAFDALGRRDIEGFLAIVDPAIEFTSLVQESEATVYRGHAGVREFLDGMLTVFSDWRPIVEHVDGFDDSTIVKARVVGTAARSGMPLEQTMWQVAWVRDGLVTGWCWYRTEAEARAALGLSDG